jgi:hypothetical protein
MKILLVSAFLVLLTGCQRPVQRFVPLGAVEGQALDTKTGQACYVYQKDPGDKGPAADLPACYDLYKQGD